MMIASIINSNKKNSQIDSIASISIEILPDFGWPMGTERAFGPGTLFQGHVIIKCNQLSFRATRLRLNFTGIETILLYNVGPGIVKSQTNTLFKITSTLWQKTENNSALKPNTKYKFLFTIQLPMVQYPPSTDHPIYRCNYKISAYLDPSLDNGEIPVIAQTKIKYIPLVETRLLKTPVYLVNNKKPKLWSPPSKISIKMHSVEYLLGDTLRFGICTNSEETLSNEISANVWLYQILAFQDKTTPTIQEMRQKQTYQLSSSNQETWLSFKLDDDLIPSVNFSSILTITYKLRIRVAIRESTKSLNSKNDESKKLKKMVTLPWPNHANTVTYTSVFETPIVIGTMGPGVRVVDELNLYHHSDNTVVPKFIKNLQHEDMLPKYEPIRLPCYSSTIGNDIQIGCITSTLPVTRSNL